MGRDQIGDALGWKCIRSSQTPLDRSRLVSVPANGTPEVVGPVLGRKRMRLWIVTVNLRSRHQVAGHFQIPVVDATLNQEEQKSLPPLSVFLE